MERLVAIPVLSFLLLLSITTTGAFASHSTVGKVIQCLISTSYPIASAIYTPENTFYITVFESYIWNLGFNTSTTRKPLFIHTALNESHIQAAVLCGKRHRLEMKIRSGGHDYEGISYWSLVTFFILHVFKYRTITVDAETATGWVQVGAILGEVHYNIANKTNNKNGFLAGVCLTVGVGGHFVGRDGTIFAVTNR